ncbi:MAG: carbohydrate ABC transporter permease [Anaerolineae bacterium]|nr:carbohydrate ABC transporter permease [Anaerolineae bacterium]
MAQVSRGAEPLLRGGAQPSWWRSARLKARLGHVLLHVVLIVTGFTFLVPLLWVVATSLKAPNQVFTYPIQWIPREPQWVNYSSMLTLLEIAGRPALLVFVKNTVIVATAAMLGTIFSSLLVGYSLARLRWPGRSLVFGLVLAVMMLPGVVTLVPLFLIFRDLGWLDTFLPLIVPSWFGSGFFIFLMRQFLTGLPIELEEAARVDGAGSLRILLRVVAPLSKPAMATVGIFSFLGHYNEFMGPLIYLDSNSNYTLALGLRMFQGRYGDRWPIVMAASTIMIAPVIVLFFFAQKQFIRGIQLGGLAGR